MSLACVLAGTAASGASAAPPLREALLVGNNWDGTADILDVPSYRRIRRINIIPDLSERLAEAAREPDGSARFPIIRLLIGEGHDQWVDDLYASNDGRTLYVSRPSLADVVAIDLATNRIVWRTPVWPGLDHIGERADHMAISPDGKRLAVSAQRLAATVPDRVDIIDTATGRMVGTFDSATTSHENVYSRDGKRIYHGSIGRVYTPTDDPALDATKGDRIFRIVDSRSLRVLKQWDMGEKLEEAGYPNMSSAVRPMVLSPDEKTLYFQVSFFHGFVEFDLERERVTRLARLPLSPATPRRREDYVLDSAHHGIAMNAAGTKLCVAGTSSNYAGIVHRKDFSYRIHHLGARTYWSTSSADGHFCYVSVAGDNTMSIISYDTEHELARVPVGYHPQRARTGRVSTAIFGPPIRLRPTSLSLRARTRGRRSLRLRGRLALPPTVAAATGCRGRVDLVLRHRRKRIARARARLRPGRRACSYARALRLRRGVSARRLSARARFRGNDLLLPRRSPAVRLRLR